MSTVKLNPVSLGFHVKVWPFGPGPGVNLDFSTFNFHVPIGIFGSGLDWPMAFPHSVVADRSMPHARQADNRLKKGISCSRGLTQRIEQALAR